MDIEQSNSSAVDRDVTYDFLLCNRCGTCRSVCPLFLVNREEWASARGKVELAEAFFRGEDIDGKDLQEVFELCLHCMACEENCPSGMRADEIVMSVRAEMARRGRIPRAKRMAIKMLEGMDNALFKVMRAFGVARRAPMHGVAGKSPLSFLFPMLGWPRDKYVPLPKNRPFLGSGPEVRKAADLEINLPKPDLLRKGDGIDGDLIDPAKAADLVERIAAVRNRNMKEGKVAYFFVGHAVNHFFPEEGEAIVKVLNLLGIDVLAPKDQVCCGAPIYYAGDIESARKTAAEALEKFTDHQYDWVVTSCSSGGLMMKDVFPRLFDLNKDGYFKIEWDGEMESFRRMPSPNRVRREYPRAADIYNEYLQGRVFDINELLVELLNLRDVSPGFGSIFRGGSAGRTAKDTGATASVEDIEDRAERLRRVPVVTYHHPCHLNRGQDIDWQPEVLLKKLPGHVYVRMRDADKCCGGGGMFTFMNSDASEAVGRGKMDAVAEVRPDILATSCPICRIQLMDMLRRRFVLERVAKGENPRIIQVMAPVELLLKDLAPIVGLNKETS